MVSEANAEETSNNTCLIGYKSSNNLTMDSETSASLTAGSIEGELGKKLKIKNEIKVTSGDNTITGGEAAFDESGGIIRVTKNLIFENSDAIIMGKKPLSGLKKKQH